MTGERKNFRQTKRPEAGEYCQAVGLSPDCDPEQVVVEGRQDVGQILTELKDLLDAFSKNAGEHQSNESFLAVDASRYTLIAKVKSPLGSGESVEVAESTNELQERINAWLRIQRDFGKWISVRLSLAMEAPETEGDLVDAP